MTQRIRTLLLLTAITTLVAACGTTTAAPESQPPEPTAPATPSVEPSEAPVEAPAEAPDAERKVHGIITVADGLAFSGPGTTIQKTLEIGPSVHPALVNGVLFRDTDGQIYLATSVNDVTAPRFDGPMLLVLNMDNTGPSWAMANAELLGLEEANGIVFHQNAQILGFLELP